MSLRMLHALSAVVIAAFVSVHIANHLAGLAGPGTHIAFMKAARLVYRNRLLEVALLGSVAVQIVSGVTLFVRGWKQRHGFVPWLQASSGVFLAFFLIIHVTSVLFGRAALHLDTNFYFASAGLHIAPFQFFLAPYYFLAVVALFTHGACAAWWQSRSLHRVARILIVAVPMAIGMTLSMLIVLSLAGELFPIEIPPEYKAPYALPRR